MSESESEKIRIYRRHLEYHSVDSKIIEITERFTMWIPKDANFWVHGLTGYLPDLKIVNQDGVELPILSDRELRHFIKKANPEVFAENEPLITQDFLKKICGEQEDTETKNLTPLKNLENISDKRVKHYVAIMLPPRSKNYFDEICIKYVLPIVNTKISKDLLSRYIERKRVIPRTTTNSDYIRISTDEKYEILGKKISFTPDDPEVKPSDEEIKELLTDEKRCVYRIKRRFKHPFTISWKIGIPFIVRFWAWVGLLLSIGLLIGSFLFFHPDDTQTIQISLGLAGAVIPIILAFHKNLFHDSELMKWWNRIYIAVIIIAILFILYMAIEVYWV